MRKFLHALKQVPKQWYKKFDQTLIKKKGFSYIEVDKCIYTKCENNESMIINLHIDDKLIFGSNIQIVYDTKSFKHQILK